MQKLSALTEEAHQHQGVVLAPSDPTFLDLTTGLREGKVEARVEAARKLRDFGPAAIEPLCAALRDKVEKVRLAAAESLGEVGDDRAVQPLVEALRDLFPGRSPLRARVGRVLFWITFPIIVVLAIAIVIISKGEALGAFFEHWLQYGGIGGGKSRSSKEYARALARIAERSPSPQLRAALPALEEITADSLQQDRRSRAASRAAARRIEALTAQLDSLPVAAAAPTTDTAALPRASGAPVPDSDTLPRTSERAG